MKEHSGVTQGCTALRRYKTMYCSMVVIMCILVRLIDVAIQMKRIILHQPLASHLYIMMLHCSGLYLIRKYIASIEC